MASEFGEVLGEVCTTWKEEYPALLGAVQHLGLPTSSWGLEPVWSCLDWYAKLGLDACDSNSGALPRPTPWKNEGPQIKMALLKVFGERCDRAADRVRDDSTTAKLFRDELHSGDVLISFNYDTIAERVATRCGRHLKSVASMVTRGVCAKLTKLCRPATPTPLGGDGVLFAKPHGSTSWALNFSSKTVSVTMPSPGGSPLVESLTLDDIIKHRREPLLLGAVPIKSELISEVQQQCGSMEVFDAISAQWRTVVETLGNADTLVIVGYSFPPEDLYGRFLVQEGLRLRGGRAPLQIKFYGRKGNEKDRETEIRKVFNGYVDTVSYRGPVLTSGA